MTQGERWRRKFASSSLREMWLEEEDTLHDVRDCLHAKEVWDRLIPSHLYAEFYLLETKGWLSWLIMRGRRKQGDGC